MFQVVVSEFYVRDAENLIMQKKKNGIKRSNNPIILQMTQRQDINQSEMNDSLMQKHLG